MNADAEILAALMEPLGRMADRVKETGQPARVRFTLGDISIRLLVGTQATQIPDSKPQTEGADKPFVPTLLQRKILSTLKGQAMRMEELAEACEVESRRLYKSGGLKELRERGSIEHHPRLGFYRPDEPPKDE